MAHSTKRLHISTLDQVVRYIEAHAVYDEHDCLVWQGQDNGNGYGMISLRALERFGFRRVSSVHRTLWRICVGEVPVGFELDHVCGNRRCVNLAHLEQVTKSENVRRGWARRKAQVAA